MNESHKTFESDNKDGANPVVAIVAAIAIAAILVVITFLLFVNSSAYTTVKDIQKNASLSSENTGDYDTTSPVKAVDIEETLKTTQEQIKDFDNQADYSPEEVSTQTLSL